MPCSRCHLPTGGSFPVLRPNECVATVAAYLVTSRAGGQRFACNCFFSPTALRFFLVSANFWNSRACDTGA